VERALGYPTLAIVAVDADEDYEFFDVDDSDSDTESTCDSESNLGGERNQIERRDLPDEVIPFDPFEEDIFHQNECAFFDRDQFNMLYAPTCGASFEANYAEGGTHNWFYDWFHYGWDRRCEESKKYISATGAGRIPHKDEATIAYHYDLEKNEIVEVQGRELHWQFEDLIKQVDLPKWEHKNVKIIALLEPLKVRTISKGNALKYWLARPVQKEFRQHLSRFPQFALTGGPNSKDTLQWLWKTTDQMVNRVKLGRPHLDLNFSHVVSGDYSSATDKLDIRATKIVFEAFLKKIRCPARYDQENLTTKWKDILRDVLYEQVLCYPKVKGQETPEDTQQCNGQLMGSNLSFPVLCAVNLIGYWLTLEEYLKVSFEPKDLPVLINGDDILFRTPKPDNADPDNFYTVWQKNLAKLGFDLSWVKTMSTIKFSRSTASVGPLSPVRNKELMSLNKSSI
jgi:hypothetical protein